MSIEKQPSKRIVSESPRNRIFTSEKQQKQISNQQPLLFWKIGLYICFQIKTTHREGNSFLIIDKQNDAFCVIRSFKYISQPAQQNI